MTIAIPGFRKYMIEAQNVEAVQSARKIYDGAASYYMGTDRLPATWCVGVSTCLGLSAGPWKPSWTVPSQGLTALGDTYCLQKQGDPTWYDVFDIGIWPMVRFKPNNLTYFAYRVYSTQTIGSPAASYMMTTISRFTFCPGMPTISNPSGVGINTTFFSGLLLDAEGTPRFPGVRKSETPCADALCGWTGP